MFINNPNTISDVWWTNAWHERNSAGPARSVSDPIPHEEIIDEHGSAVVQMFIEGLDSGKYESVKFYDPSAQDAVAWEKDAETDREQGRATGIIATPSYLVKVVFPPST